jgi:chromosome segregation ATPase
MGFVCWWQELELRAHDRYGALDQMSAELRQLREQRNALDALAEALRTRDGWLAYRAEALRDQLLELEGQSTARPSAIERVRTALINWDKALQQARGDLERARTVAAYWEAEVVSVRASNRQVHAELKEARSRQGQAEQKAKEAEELKVALAAKVPRLSQRRSSSGRSVPPARRPMVSSSRSGPPSLIFGRRSSGSMLLSRERRRC